MEGRYQCAVLAPYKAGQFDSRMVCFLRHRGLSPVGRGEMEIEMGTTVSPCRFTQLS